MRTGGEILKGPKPRNLEALILCGGFIIILNLKNVQILNFLKEQLGEPKTK